MILQDLERETSETLSPSIPIDILNSTVPHYVRVATDGVQQLDILAELFGLSWWIFANGTLWLGRETWPMVEVVHDLLANNAAMNTAEIATDQVSLDLVPGVTFLDRRISFVEHRIEPDELHTYVKFEHADGSAMNTAQGALVKLIESAMASGSVPLGTFTVM